MHISSLAARESRPVALGGQGPALEGLVILSLLIRPHNCTFLGCPPRGFGWGSDLRLPSLPISSEVQ